jgi:hypothetical protein
VTLKFSGWLYYFLFTDVIGPHHYLCLHKDLFSLHVFTIPISSDLYAEVVISTSFSTSGESVDGV